MAAKSAWIPTVVGDGGGRQSCAQRHGEEEGEEENKEREREQSVNVLTGTHKEPVLSKNLIQD